jgi:ribosomal protein RSM22 (predicted rRNA methylase)
MPGTLRASDLAALARLRESFLTGTNTGGGYWRDEQDLALYDATFAERIGWKWDAVIGDLTLRGWRPQSRHVLDFGCGSGVAGRRVLSAWPDFESLALSDVSPAAVQYAEKRARDGFPRASIQALNRPPRTCEGALLLVSHVINELDVSARDQLLALARTAAEVIWVESGTHADSRALIAVRENLKNEFSVVAPCTHRAACGMLAAENARHWCHHFARVPSEVSRDAGWSQFSRELGIDLTTLPYSYLALARNGPAGADAACRIIGTPREARGRMELLCCDATGVAEQTLQKRDEPALFKALQKGRADTVQRFRTAGGKLRTG